MSRINWYTNVNKTSSLIPKAPKSPKPKVKRIFKGPKLPNALKKKLYIPTKLVHAYLLTNASYMSDQSAGVIRNIYDVASSLGINISVEWINDSDDARCGGNKYTGKTCRDLEAYPPTIEELTSGLWSVSHPNCNCHVNLALSNGQNYRISFDTMDVPAIVNQDEEAVARGEPFNEPVVEEPQEAETPWFLK